MLKRSELSVEKSTEGAWRIFALVNGQLQSRRYYGYTKQEAVARYLAEFN
jgi:hypothetical protein